MLNIADLGGPFGEFVGLQFGSELAHSLHSAIISVSPGGGVFIVHRIRRAIGSQAYLVSTRTLTPI